MPCTIDDLENPALHQSESNQASQTLEAAPNFGDSSVPFFSIYSKIAEEEDNRMTDRWQKDAEGILIFVSVCVDIQQFEFRFDTQPRSP